MTWAVVDRASDRNVKKAEKPCSGAEPFKYTLKLPNKKTGECKEITRLSWRIDLNGNELWDFIQDHGKCVVHPVSDGPHMDERYFMITIYDDYIE